MNFRNSIISRVISSIVVVAFCLTTILPPSYAQSINLLNLPVPGTMVNLSQPFVPVLLKGMTLHPDDPFRFDFIIDTGNTKFTQEELKKESERLVKYFLASMTVPKNDLWVNLSPYEKDRIVPDALGKTELGRDMLAQDYILKQLTASLMYPEKELGQKFWDKIRKISKERYGTDEIPMDTFNKVWIVPEVASVYEHEQTVYIAQTHLKVMLEDDYIAREASVIKRDAKNDSKYPAYMKQIIREVIIPAIEKEVNEGENFAQLRQIYHSLILAKWYKETIKNSLLAKVYVDKNKVVGIENDDEAIKDKIYERYVEAFKKGVYDYIKEDYETTTQESIPRKYFSGGIKGDFAVLTRRNVLSSIKALGDQFKLSLELQPIQNGRVFSRRQFIKQTVASAAVAGVVLGNGRSFAVSQNSEYDNLLKSPYMGTRVEAAETLGNLGDKRAIEPLIRALNDENGSVREAAAIALGKLGDKIAVEPLIQMLGGPSYEGDLAAEILGDLGDKRAVEPLIHFLINYKPFSYPSPYVSADALGKLGDKRAVEPLIKILRDPTSSARRSAAQALGDLGDKRAIEPLIEAAFNNNPVDFDLQRAAVTALEKFGVDPYKRYKTTLKILAGGSLWYGINVFRSLLRIRQLNELPTVPYSALLKSLGYRVDIDNELITTTADDYFFGPREISYELPTVTVRGHLITDFINVISTFFSIKSDKNESDSALLPKDGSEVGGIDLNLIDVRRQGEGVNINYNPAVLEPILNQPIDGFKPVIINLTPLPSLAPLLGFETDDKKEAFEVSSR